MNDSPEPQQGLDNTEAIESLLFRLEQAARENIAAAQFYRTLVSGLFASLPAQQASAWVEAEGGVQCAFALARPVPPDEELLARQIQPLVVCAANRRSDLMLPPGAAVDADDVPNDSGFLQLLSPRRTDGVPGVILHVALPESASLRVRETAGNLLAALADIAQVYQTHVRLRRLQRGEQFFQQLDAAVRAMHAASGVSKTAEVIAEQVRTLTDSDRVSVLLRKGRQCRLAAVTATVSFDRRSRQVRLLEQMASEVLRSGQGIEVIVGETRPGVAAMYPSLDTWLDETQARGVRCELLRNLPADDTTTSPDAPPVGLLITEAFSAERAGSWAQRLPELAAHAGQALAHSIEIERRGWRRLLYPFQSLSRTALWSLVAFALLATVVTLTVLQTDFTVEANGVLMPAQRRGIFAMADAVVTGVHVNDGDRVDNGDPLITLTDPDLELELSRLQGELATASARLDAVRARRKLRSRDRDAEAASLAIEAEELEVTVAGLTAQLDVLRMRRSELEQVSPIRGVVSRWDLRDVLLATPVTHGQHLMDVYDPDGPWRLELQVPDDVAGYVREAAASGPRPVHDVFQTDAAHTRTVTLTSIADATELDADNKLTVRALVLLNPDELTSPRRGATVIARIHCGRRSLGFVWFREIIEFVYKRILF